MTCENTTMVHRIHLTRAKIAFHSRTGLRITCHAVRKTQEKGLVINIWKVCTALRTNIKITQMHSMQETIQRFYSKNSLEEDQERLVHSPRKKEQISYHKAIV
jgi:hypothetical protein